MWKTKISKEDSQKRSFQTRKVIINIYAAIKYISLKDFFTESSSTEVGEYGLFRVRVRVRVRVLTSRVRVRVRVLTCRVRVRVRVQTY
jgi:hypothetical protein